MVSFQEYSNNRDLNNLIAEAAQLMESVGVDPHTFITKELYLMEQEMAGQVQNPSQQSFWGRVGSWFRKRMGTNLEGRYQYAVKALQALVAQLGDNAEAKQMIEKMILDLQTHQQGILSQPTDQAVPATPVTPQPSSQPNQAAPQTAVPPIIQ